MWQRILGVFKLDIATFEEIEHDETATSQAAIVVGIVGVLSAIGAFAGAMVANNAFSSIQDTLGADFDMPFAMPTLSPIGAALSALIGAFLAWVIWSALTYFIGTRLFEGDADMGQMLRVLGFAQAPRLLSIFSFIPCLGALLALAGAIWSLVASFIAVRQGLDIDNGKALITIIISFVVTVAASWLMGTIFGGIF